MRIARVQIVAPSVPRDDKQLHVHSPRRCSHQTTPLLPSRLVDGTLLHQSGGTTQEIGVQLLRG
jgi:hypothetical protein